MLVEIAIATMVQTSNWYRVSRQFICGPFDEIVKSLESDEFKESPIWLGKKDDTRMVLMVNKTTGAWTIIHYSGQIGCVIAAGDSSTKLIDP